MWIIYVFTLMTKSKTLQHRMLRTLKKFSLHFSDQKKVKKAGIPLYNGMKISTVLGTCQLCHYIAYNHQNIFHWPCSPFVHLLSLLLHLVFTFRTGITYGDLSHEWSKHTAWFKPKTLENIFSLAYSFVNQFSSYLQHISHIYYIC